MIFFILIISFLLRIVNLDQSFWLDEAAQVILSSDSIKNIFLTHSPDFHPPLSYLILHYWIYFGVSEFWLRLLSVAFGVLTVWVTYKLSSLIFNKRIGLFSAFFLAIAPYHIYYSQEVRMYSEAAFFAVLSMFFLFRFLKENKLRDRFGYVIATTMLIYTHYDGFFLIFSQLIYLLIQKRSSFKLLLKVFLFIFLLYFPWLPQFLQQLTAGLNIDNYLPGWKDVLSIPFYKALPLILFKFTLGRIDFDNIIIYIILAGLTCSFVGYILYKSFKKITSDDNKLIIYWLVIPILTVMVVSFKIPINQPFRILYTLPAFCILLALGITSITKYKKIFLVGLISVFALGLSLYYFNPKYWREDWRGAVKFILKKTDPDNIVFAWPDSFPPYKFYAPQKNAHGVVNKFPAKLEEVENTLKYTENKKEVYLFEYLQELSDPNKNIQSVLIKKGFKENEIYDFRGVGFIRKYIK